MIGINLMQRMKDSIEEKRMVKMLVTRKKVVDV